MNPFLYTIAICTFNRAPIVEICLQSILDYGPKGLPVIVVDNGSTDHTLQIVEGFKNRLNVTLIQEKRAGVSYARNTAYEHCKTEYIVYLDDDARVTPQWFRGIDEGLRSEGMPDYFGGPYGPYYLIEKPVWFKDQYGSDHLKQKGGKLGPNDHLSGGNMGWKVELLAALKGFPVDLGPVGEVMIFGEDSSVVHRAQTEMPERRGVFLPEMKMEHLVPAHKMTLSYCTKRFWRLGRDDFRSFPGRYPLTLKTCAYEIALIPFLPIYTLFRPRSRYPYWQNLYYEVGLWRVRFWGRVYTRLFGWK